MGDNFMSASTQIENLVNKKEQINEKVAGLLASAIKTRMQNAQLKKSIINDILKTIRHFNDEDKSKILATTIFYLMSGHNNETSKPYIDPTTGNEWKPSRDKTTNLDDDDDLFSPVFNFS